MFLEIDGRTDVSSRYEAGDSQIFGQTRGAKKQCRGSDTCLDWQKGHKINEDVEFIDATVDGLQILLDHKTKEDQLESEFINTKIYT